MLPSLSYPPEELSNSDLIHAELPGFSFHGPYAAIRIVLQLNHLQAPQPCFSSGRHTVVVEEVAFPLKFADGMMGGPSHHRGQDNTLIGEGSVGIIANGITQ